MSQEDECMIADLLPIYAINERGSYLTLPLPDGRVADIVPRTFGQAQIAVSRGCPLGGMEAMTYDDMW